MALLKLYYRDNCGDFSPMFTSPSLSSNNRYVNPRAGTVATNKLSKSHHNMMNNVLLATVQNCVIMHVFRPLFASCFFLLRKNLLLCMIIYFILDFSSSSLLLLLLKQPNPTMTRWMQKGENRISGKSQTTRDESLECFDEI